MGSYAPSSWEWSLNIHYLKFFCTGSLSFLLIYLFIQYFIYSNIDSWIFVLSFGPYNSMLIYLFVSVSLIYFHQCGFFFFIVVFVFVLCWALSCFLELQLALHLPCVFPMSVLESNYFSKKPWLLLLENGRRNQDAGNEWGCFYWGVISFRTSRLTELGNKCICPVLYKYIFYIIIYIISILLV